MMKISDPIIFGHAVSVFYREAFEKHAASLAKVGANPNNGLGDVLAKVATLPQPERDQVEKAFQESTTAARGWPWWTPARASPTSTSPPTSSSTPPCPP